MKNQEQVIEYADMTDEQKRIVDAGNTIAGVFPKFSSEDELRTWMRSHFSYGKRFVDK